MKTMTNLIRAKSHLLYGLKTNYTVKETIMVSIIMIVLGIMSFGVAAILPVLPVVLVILTVGGVLGSIIKIFKG